MKGGVGRGRTRRHRWTSCKLDDRFPGQATPGRPDSDDQCRPGSRRPATGHYASAAGRDRTIRNAGASPTVRDRSTCRAGPWAPFRDSGSRPTARPSQVDELAPGKKGGSSSERRRGCRDHRGGSGRSGLTFRRPRPIGPPRLSSKRTGWIASGRVYPEPSPRSVALNSVRTRANLAQRRRPTRVWSRVRRWRSSVRVYRPGLPTSVRSQLERPPLGVRIAEMGHPAGRVAVGSRSPE